MAAKIYVLPMIPLEARADATIIQVRLPKKMAVRVARSSREWKMSQGEAIVAILDQYFQSIRQR